MHTQTVDIETFATVLEQLHVTSRTDTGELMITAGTHPRFGQVVMIQSPATATIVSDTVIDEIKLMLCELDG